MSRRFWKMSGSGNDFVVVDARGWKRDPLETSADIQRLCARGTGIGADGVVFVAEASQAGATVAMRYYNSDGSRGEFCGNATLCVTNLAGALGMGKGGVQWIETDAGLISSRAATGDGFAALELPAVSVAKAQAEGIARREGESRIGFAVAGVPHLVVWTDDLESAPLLTRGKELRHAAKWPGGANVNYVARHGAGWSMRTFERGVEGETLACGSGAISTALVLGLWGESGEDTDLLTRSGRTLTVRLRPENGVWWPILAGEGRIVFYWRDP